MLLQTLEIGVDADSSDDEEEESDLSDFDEIKNLKLSNNGLSVADVIQQANSQSNKNLKVCLCKIYHCQNRKFTGLYIVVQ